MLLEERDTHWYTNYLSSILSDTNGSVLSGVYSPLAPLGPLITSPLHLTPLKSCTHQLGIIIQAGKHECHVRHVSGVRQPIRTKTKILTMNDLRNLPRQPLRRRDSPLMSPTSPGSSDVSYHQQNDHYSPGRAVPYCCQPSSAQMPATRRSGDWSSSLGMKRTNNWLHWRWLNFVRPPIQFFQAQDTWLLAINSLEATTSWQARYGSTCCSESSRTENLTRSTKWPTTDSLPSFGWIDLWHMPTQYLLQCLI